MRVNKVLGGIAAVQMALLPIAATAATPVGSVVSVSGDTFVARNGRLLRATPNMAISSGDRLISRSGGNATVSLGNCSVSVGSSEMKTMSGNACSGAAESFDRASYTGDSSALRDRDGHRSGGIIIISILALAAIIAGIIAATSGSSHPASP